MEVGWYLRETRDTFLELYLRLSWQLFSVDFKGLEQKRKRESVWDHALKIRGIRLSWLDQSEEIITRKGSGKIFRRSGVEK